MSRLGIAERVVGVQQQLTKLEQSILADAGLASGIFDEPSPGEIRAVIRSARDYTLDHWRHVLLACLGDEPAEREDAIEASAIWAAENMGLEYERLPKDGLIVKGLKSAIRSALRRGEIEKVGTREIKISV